MSISKMSREDKISHMSKPETLSDSVQLLWHCEVRLSENGEKSGGSWSWSRSCWASSRWQYPWNQGGNPWGPGADVRLMLKLSMSWMMATVMAPMIQILMTIYIQLYIFYCLKSINCHIDRLFHFCPPGTFDKILFLLWSDIFLDKYFHIEV